MQTHQYGILELELQSCKDHKNPDREIQVFAEFTSPSSIKTVVNAFWDGGRSWRVRFSPGEIGAWSWCTTCHGVSDEGLVRRDETFECVAYTGNNPIFVHGPLQLSASRRHIEYADGTPFFWLGDTAWNGVIRGDDENWRRYLELRVAQRYNVIQFVASHWRGDELDDAGEPSFFENGEFSINPAFFQRLDHRVAMINAYGLIAAPVALWSLLDSDPGCKLSEENACCLAKYIFSRYDAYQVVWLLGGDGDYKKNGIDRWKRLGRSVFSLGHNRLASLHPCGQTWVGTEFGTEDWYDIIGYQSGHGDGEDHLQWLVKGPPATAWVHTPPHPIINMEPNYETARGYKHQIEYSAYHVRRAAYWSLLVSPMAGITYGHDSIWNWNFVAGPSEGHGSWHGGCVPAWDTGLDTPGIRCMTILRDLIERLDWTTAMPYQELLAEQPGDENVEAFIAVSRMADGAVILYTPLGGTVHFNPEAVLQEPLYLVDPETGETIKTLVRNNNAIELPEQRDWLVVSGASQMSV